MGAIVSYLLMLQKYISSKQKTRKVKKAVHPPITFNNKPVQQVLLKKHLRLILDTSLTFD